MIKITVDLESPEIKKGSKCKVSKELELFRTVSKLEDIDQLQTVFKQLVDLQLDCLIEEAFEEFKQLVKTDISTKASKKVSNDENQGVKH